MAERLSGARFIVSLAALERNARVLREVADAAGCGIVLALKGFACWRAFPVLAPHLDGCCASGLWEARLARDHFGKRVLTYSPAYEAAEVAELLEFTDHLDFNSLAQWRRFRPVVTTHPRFRTGELHCGLRINPECSTGATPLYDPCTPGSRLGMTAADLDDTDLDGISGLHFHTLCEQGAADLERTLAAVEEKFSGLLRSPQIRWLNMGGGHWITKPDYDRARLVRLVREARARYGVDVWLEPGEAAAIHTGVLRATVLDTFESAGHRHAILDVSATAHMPDVLEMPYRPEVFLVERGPGAAPRLPSPALPAVVLPGEIYHRGVEPRPAVGVQGEAGGSAPPQSAIRTPQSAIHTGRRIGDPRHDVGHAATEPAPSRSAIRTPQPAIHTVRLGGPTCLAGDVIGDYAFPRPLVAGDTLVFDDMAHYTMVKTTFFNGVRHPAIVLEHPDGRLETVREFGYDDFRDRLGG